MDIVSRHDKSAKWVQALRNTVCYSILAGEWPDMNRWLTMRLQRRSQSRNR
jgi:hypothetical protein